MTDLTAIRGVGPKRAERFRELGIASCEELVLNLPRRYEDRTKIRTVEELEDGVRATLFLELLQISRLLYLKGKRTLQRTKWSDQTGSVEIVWHNQPYAARNLHVGKSYCVYGEYNAEKHSIANPRISELPPTEFARIEPVYSLTAGLSNGERKRAAREALGLLRLETLESLPASVRERAGIRTLAEDLEQAHFPDSPESLRRALTALRFRELLVRRTAAHLLSVSQEASVAVPIDSRPLSEYLDSLPYRLTDDQQRAVLEIAEDLEKPKPMNRLLQGDVGSGKTVVALAACFLAAKAGRQAAFMAPTEVLALQHEREAKSRLEPLGIPVYRLTGSMSASERRASTEAAASGVAGLWVGTQALFQESVAFDSLSVVVTDEQHRFGVAQRKSFSGKGDFPHALVLSATPIPRTLALTLFGELDVSRIRQKPSGRKPIATYAVDIRYEKRACEFVAKQAEAGHQAYVVCPRIDEGEEEFYFSLEKTLKRWGNYLTNRCRIAALHGRMRPEEKDRILGAFYRGEIDVLMATTVVEVGIDVANATAMVICAADRFGLAQLHQLRGRVGRGDAASTCILIAENTGQAVRARLRIMEQTEDGFEIAEKDLAIRGAGEAYGLAQHGIVEGDFGSEDGELVERVEEIFAELRPDRLAKDGSEPAFQAAVEREMRKIDRIIMN